MAKFNSTIIVSRRALNRWLCGDPTYPQPIQVSKSGWMPTTRTEMWLIDTYIKSVDRFWRSVPNNTQTPKVDHPATRHCCTGQVGSSLLPVGDKSLKSWRGFKLITKNQEVLAITLKEKRNSKFENCVYCHNTALLRLLLSYGVANDDDTLQSIHSSRLDRTPWLTRWWLSATSWECLYPYIDTQEGNKYWPAASNTTDLRIQCCKIDTAFSIYIWIVSAVSCSWWFSISES